MKKYLAVEHVKWLYNKFNVERKYCFGVDHSLVPGYTHDYHLAALSTVLRSVLMQR